MDTLLLAPFPHLMFNTSQFSCLNSNLTVLCPLLQNTSDMKNFKPVSHNLSFLSTMTCRIASVMADNISGVLGNTDWLYHDIDGTPSAVGLSPMNMEHTTRFFAWLWHSQASFKDRFFKQILGIWYSSALESFWRCAIRIYVSGTYMIRYDRRV